MQLLAAVLACASAIAAPQDPASPDLESLLGDLSASDFARRERATEAIETLSPTARAALAARRDALPLEARLRLDEILERIASGGSRLLRPLEPTLVTLAMEDRPLSEILDALFAAGRSSLASPAGAGAELQAALAREWMGRRTSFSAEGVPFLEAVDRLAEAEGLTIARDYRSGDFVASAEPPMPLPRRYAGPLRVSLTSFAITRMSRFVGEPSTTAHLQVQVDLEDDAPVAGILNPARIAEARDDRGRSLSGGAPPANRFFVAPVPRPQMHFVVNLVPPERDALRIEVLELVLDVIQVRAVASASIKDPDLTLRAPAPGPREPEGAQGAIQLAIDGVQDAGAQRQVQVSFRPPAPEGEALPGMAVFWEEVRLFDREGRALKPLAVQRAADAGGRQVRTLILGAGAAPAEIEVRVLARYEVTPLAVRFEGIAIP